jgi:hypothetical protein
MAIDHLLVQSSENSDGELEWFFFDEDGVAHYYDDYDECCAAARLTWYPD